MIGWGEKSPRKMHSFTTTYIQRHFAQSQGRVVFVTSGRACCPVGERKALEVVQETHPGGAAPPLQLLLSRPAVIYGPYRPAVNHDPQPGTESSSPSKPRRLSGREMQRARNDLHSPCPFQPCPLLERKQATNNVFFFPNAQLKGWGNKRELRVSGYSILTPETPQNLLLLPCAQPTRFTLTHWDSLSAQGPWAVEWRRSHPPRSLHGESIQEPLLILWGGKAQPEFSQLACFLSVF